MYFFFFATAFIFFPHLIPFFFYQELDHVLEQLEKIAAVNLLWHRAIISLIGNVQRLSLILEMVQYTFCIHLENIF